MSKSSPGWWFQTLWKIWKSVGMAIFNLWENKKCSKPPTRIVFKLCMRSNTISVLFTRFLHKDVKGLLARSLSNISRRDLCKRSLSKISVQTVSTSSLDKIYWFDLCKRHVYKISTRALLAKSLYKISLTYQNERCETKRTIYREGRSGPTWRDLQTQTALRLRRGFFTCLRHAKQGFRAENVLKVPRLQLKYETFGREISPARARLPIRSLNPNEALTTSTTSNMATRFGERTQRN